MLGKPAPDFSLTGTGGTFRMKNERGSKLVLYFYPKDNTSGCTEQGADFRDQYKGVQGQDEVPVRAAVGRGPGGVQAVRRDQAQEHVREKGPRHRAQHLCG